MGIIGPVELCPDEIFIQMEEVGQVLNETLKKQKMAMSTFRCVCLHSQIQNYLTYKGSVVQGNSTSRENQAIVFAFKVCLMGITRYLPIS